LNSFQKTNPLATEASKQAAHSTAEPRASSKNFARFADEDDDEHEDEPLVADFGASSVERFAAL
jgi:hypothetical protein